MTPEQHDNRESAAAAIVALAAFAVLCVLLSAVGAAEYSVTVEPSAYVVTVETAKPPESSNLPEVTMFSVPGCQPCMRAEKDDKDGKFKGLFTIKKWDVTVREAPIEASLFPVFYWRGSDGRMWRYPPENPPDNTVHYPGHAELIRIWKETQDKPKGQQLLQNSQQLTPEQWALYQQARRAGYSDGQIMQYARKRGYIK